MKTNGKWITSLTAITLAVMAGRADATAKTGLNTFSFGNSNAGASGTYSVNVENRTAYSHVALAADGTVKLLGKNIKGVAFSAATDNNNGKKSSTYSLSVGGYTVDSGTKSVSYNWSKQKTCTLLSASSVIVVGGIPVTIRGDVGGGAQVNYNLALNTTGVGLGGGGSVWGSGTASGGLGVTWLNLALKSDLQMMKTGLNGQLNVTPSTMGGNVYLAYDPLKIDFSLALMTGGKVWASYLLGSYAQPQRSLCLIQL